MNLYNKRNWIRKCRLRIGVAVWMLVLCSKLYYVIGAFLFVVSQRLYPALDG